MFNVPPKLMLPHAPNLVVLSPHSDDACFSLAGVLGEYSVKGELWTVFSKSVFALNLPDSNSRTQEYITRVRQLEDREFASVIGLEYRGIGFEEPAIRCLKPFGHRDIETERKVTEVLKSLLASISEAHEHVSRPLIMAPLGVGQHIDHLATRAAAVSWWRERAVNLLFYSELPYSSSTDAVISAVRSLKLEFGIDLDLFHRYKADSAAAKKKLELCMIYKTQYPLFSTHHAYLPELLFEPRNE